MLRKVYKTRRLELRPYRVKDYECWRQACLLPNSKVTNKWDVKAPTPSKKFFTRIVKRHFANAHQDQTYVWGVFEKKSGKLIGVVDIHILQRDVLQMANLGYRIFNQYWGLGYGKEVVRKLILSSLLDLKLNRLEAVIDMDNKRSIHLVKSIELRREGLRKNYWFQHKKWDDQIVFIADRTQFKLPKLKL